MAALLRSSRFLKLSPSGLLQIAGLKQNSPPLGRLYSGVACSRWTGVSPLHSRHVCEIPFSVHSRVWPHAFGCQRNYIVATEQRDESSLVVPTRQAQQFDWALTKLNSSVKRTGRITKQLLLRIFHDICRKGYPSGNQALLLLRSCGSLLPEMHRDERTELAHRVWDKLQELGAQYDVSHYNALLKVYLQNEFKFSPTDFLAKMEAAGVHPNRVTYQRLITAYCHNGDIEGASTILGFMKSKDLPITEAVFSSLVTGHARAGDIESAKNILSVMQGAGIEPGPETYLSLLTAYAEIGDMENIKKCFEAVESADCILVDRDIMQVILTLARFGHQQLIPEMAERLRHERGYIPDAMNLCLNLITLGLEDTAFSILKTFPSFQSESVDGDSNNLGNFFLRHCINIDTPLEKIIGFCKELQDSNTHSSPLTFTLSCALEAKKLGPSLELMKLLKEQDLPVRPHFFWPLLSHHLKENNVPGMMEVIKGMKKLSVSLDADTLSNYILPAFPSPEAAQQALEDTGLSLDLEQFLFSEIRTLASNDLAKLYNLLSDPSYSPPDLALFRSSLINGFRKSSDVETMVKITKMLQNDERFSSESSKASGPASYFLYNLILVMSEEQLQAQEDKLRSFFNQLRAEEVVISMNIFRGIRKLLVANQVPELVKDVLALVEPNEDGESVTASAQDNSIENEQFALEKKLAELNAENKPVSNIFRQLLQTLNAEENLQRALELKQQHEEEMTMGAYATLIHLCCRHNNVEEAMNLKREMSRKDSSVALTTSKYLALVKALAMNDRVDEAVDILKEMKEKEVVLNDVNKSAIYHLLNTLVDIAAIRRLQDTIFTLGLAKPNANLCTPLVNAYMESNDFSGALDTVLECQKRYNQLPRIHDVVVALVERGDTDLLQKAMDFLSQERGEMAMLYELFFAFLQTGRYKEARKIVETPGMRARPGRLQWYAEKCINTQKMDALEQMVNITEKLFECDRDEMYSYIIRLCKETNNWQKAEATWTKMQEENVIPRERTLRLLADVLKTNGQVVPFEEPESWYEHEANEKEKPKEAPAAATQNTDYNSQVLILCKKGKANEAYKVLKKTEKDGVALDANAFDVLIRALLAKGSIEDAMAVKNIAQSHTPNFKLGETANSLLIITYTKRDQVKDALDQLKLMLQSEQIPLNLAIIRLVQAMSNHGDVKGIQEVQSLLKNFGANLNLSSMLFINNTSLAHIQNGDVESAVEILEGVYTNPDSSNASMSFVFRKLLEADNDKALDKLSAMAERLANHFACYRPASDLFLQLLDNGKYEDAKFMLARTNAIAHQKEMLLSYVSQKSQRPGQIGKIKDLLSLIPDFAEKEVLYAYQMKCHVMDKDLVSAKALHQQMQEEGINVDELSLKRLAGLYRNAGETVPFPEPPESFKFYAEKLKVKTGQAQASAEE